MYLIPALTLSDIEGMSIRDIVKRLSLVNNFCSDKKKAELKSFFSVLYLAISAGNNSSKKNNKIFYKELNKIFDDPKKENLDNEQDLIGLMNLVNKNNVKK